MACNSNCSSGTECICPDYKIKQYSTDPPFRVAIEDCSGVFDLSDGSLQITFNMWSSSKLSRNISANETSLYFADDIGFDQVIVGDVIVLNSVRGNEMMLVVGVDDEYGTIFVQRGHNGTSSRAWKRGQELFVYRIINGATSVEIIESEVEQEDGSLVDTVMDSFIVVDLSNGMTRVPGCYIIEFTLTKYRQDGTIDWIRRFPEDGFFSLQVVPSPTPIFYPVPKFVHYGDVTIDLSLNLESNYVIMSTSYADVYVNSDILADGEVSVYETLSAQFLCYADVDSDGYIEGMLPNTEYGNTIFETSSILESDGNVVANTTIAIGEAIISAHAEMIAEGINSNESPEASLLYEGSFRVARVDSTGQEGGTEGQKHRYLMGGAVMGVFENTLWLSTHNNYKYMGKLNIPADHLLKDASLGVGTLPIASAASAAFDCMGSIDNQAVIEEAGEGRLELSGIIPEGDGNTLKWVSHHYYNVAQKTYKSMGETNYNDGVNITRSGPYGMVVGGVSSPDQQFGVDICRLPVIWAGRLGGDYLSGGGGLSGQGSTGMGPMVHTFDWTPNANNRFVGNRLVFYPMEHPLSFWNHACAPESFEWVKNDLIIAARIGSGEIWYGDNVSPNGKVDNFNRDKSYHAEFYTKELLWYSGEDLEMVRNGDMETWEIQPTRTPIPNLIGNQYKGVRMSKYDNRLYILQQDQDWGYTPYEQAPVVHVFTVS